MHIHKNPPLFYILSHMNPVKIFNPTFVTSILILFSNHCLGLPSRRFHSSFASKVLQLHIVLFAVHKVLYAVHKALYNLPQEKSVQSLKNFVPLFQQNEEQVFIYMYNFFCTYAYEHIFCHYCNKYSVSGNQLKQRALNTYIAAFNILFPYLFISLNTIY